MQTRVHQPSPAVLRRLGAALRRGELVAIPTETVYGLAANALDTRACRRIFTAKRRPADDPLIVHVGSRAQAETLARFNESARELARALWPGPLTLVLERTPLVPDVVTSGQSSVAVRCPAHGLARRILRDAGVPLAAPSANPFGYVSPTTAAHVLAGLGGRIGHVLDGGACRVGVESTIVDVRDPRRLVILRPGAVSAADLRRVLRAAGIRVVVGTKRRELVLSPGLLDQHYSPHTPFRLVPKVDRAEAADADCAVIRWRRPQGRSSELGRIGFWLSRRGEAAEAARRLYRVLREADESGCRAILCEKAPASAGALGEAINDRLARAAGKKNLGAR